MADTSQGWLQALLVVFAFVIVVQAFILLRVAFENPGIIRKSLSGGVSAPKSRSYVTDSSPRESGAQNVVPQHTSTQGNAVIAALGAAGPENPLLEKKIARRRISIDGPGIGEERLPDWEVDHKKLRFKYTIGKGNFGEVWLATWLGSPVAVKTVVPELQNKEKLLKRFQDEIMLMSTLHHPNVVLFLGACTRRPHLCLVIEYCVHGSMHHFLKNEDEHGVRITMSLVLRFALDIARGTYYLHRRCSVVQRDLKARNILVDESLNAKVADFGLSRVLNEEEANKLTACGTPAWTAPEIVKMEAYTDKVDVYSFGIILWELITREEPYGGQKGVQIAYAAAEQGLRPEVPSYCPTDYADLMRQCWADDASERPTMALILKKLFQMKKLCDVEAAKAMSDPTAKPFFLHALPKYIPSNAGGAMIETRHGPRGAGSPAHPLRHKPVEVDEMRPIADTTNQTKNQSALPCVETPGAVMCGDASDIVSTPLAREVVSIGPSFLHSTNAGGDALPTIVNDNALQQHLDLGILRVFSDGPNEWDGDVGESDEEVERGGRPHRGRKSGKGNRAIESSGGERESVASSDETTTTTAAGLSPSGNVAVKVWNAPQGLGSAIAEKVRP